MTKIELAKMTWVEAREAAKKDPVIMIPVGAMEAHGQQTPVGADWLSACRVAKEAASLTSAVVAPPICFGYSDSFIGFEGSISIRPSTLAALLKDVITQLIGQGFRRYLLVNSHAGNDSIIDQVGQEIRRESPGVVIAMLSPWALAKDLTKDLYAGREAVMGHGAEPVASVMCAVAPDDMRMDLAVQDKYSSFLGFPIKRGAGAVGSAGPFKVIYSLKEISKTGTLGDGRVASRETGEIILKRIIDYVAATVKDLQNAKLD